MPWWMMILIVLASLVLVALFRRPLTRLSVTLLGKLPYVVFQTVAQLADAGRSGLVRQAWPWVLAQAKITEYGDDFIAVLFSRLFYCAAAILAILCEVSLAFLRINDVLLRGPDSQNLPGATSFVVNAQDATGLLWGLLIVIWGALLADAAGFLPVSSRLFPHLGRGQRIGYAVFVVLGCLLSAAAYVLLIMVGQQAIWGQLDQSYYLAVWILSGLFALLIFWVGVALAAGLKQGWPAVGVVVVGVLLLSCTMLRRVFQALADVAQFIGVEIVPEVLDSAGEAGGTVLGGASALPGVGLLSRPLIQSMRMAHAADEVAPLASYASRAALPEPSMALSRAWGGMSDEEYMEEQALKHPATAHKISMIGVYSLGVTFARVWYPILVNQFGGVWTMAAYGEFDPDQLTLNPRDFTLPSTIEDVSLDLEQRKTLQRTLQPTLIAAHGTDMLKSNLIRANQPSRVPGGGTIIWAQELTTLSRSIAAFKSLHHLLPNHTIVVIAEMPLRFEQHKALGVMQQLQELWEQDIIAGTVLFDRRSPFVKDYDLENRDQVHQGEEVQRMLVAQMLSSFCVGPAHNETNLTFPRMLSKIHTPFLGLSVGVREVQPDKPSFLYELVRRPFNGPIRGPASVENSLLQIQDLTRALFEEETTRTVPAKRDQMHEPEIVQIVTPIPLRDWKRFSQFTRQARQFLARTREVADVSVVQGVIERGGRVYKMSMGAFFGIGRVAKIRESLDRVGVAGVAMSDTASSAGTTSTVVDAEAGVVAFESDESDGSKQITAPVPVPQAIRTRTRRSSRSSAPHNTVRTHAEPLTVPSEGQ